MQGEREAQDGLNILLLAGGKDELVPLRHMESLVEGRQGRQ